MLNFSHAPKAVKKIHAQIIGQYPYSYLNKESLKDQSTITYIHSVYRVKQTALKDQLWFQKLVASLAVYDMHENLLHRSKDGLATCSVFVTCP